MLLPCLRVMVIKLLTGNYFVRQAKINGDKTQVEMAKLWDGEISSRTISRALKKIGFTRKKRLMAIGRWSQAAGVLRWVVHLTAGHNCLCWWIRDGWSASVWLCLEWTRWALPCTEIWATQRPLSIWLPPDATKNWAPLLRLRERAIEQFLKCGLKQV